MLKKNSKTMFFTLLIPLYFLIVICIFGISAGGIEWIPALEFSLLVLLAAWSLSRDNSLILNLAGFMIYALMGGYCIYSTLTKATRIGPWTFNIYLGIALILFGLCTFACAIVRFIRKRKSTAFHSNYICNNCF